MEALFKKYFWVIKTLGIAVACGLAASAVTTQVGARLLFDNEAVEGDTEGDPEEGEGEGESDGEEATPKKPKKGIAFTDEAFGVTAAATKTKEKERVGDRIRKRNVF